MFTSMAALVKISKIFSISTFLKTLHDQQRRLQVPESGTSLSKLFMIHVTRAARWHLPQSGHIDQAATVAYWFLPPLTRRAYAPYQPVDNPRTGAATIREGNWGRERCVAPMRGVVAGAATVAGRCGPRRSRCGESWLPRSPPPMQGVVAAGFFYR
jgi:hypothetical protein